MIKILRAFLTDRVKAARRFCGQRSTPATGAIGQTALVSKRLKIHFLDLNFSPDIRPAPFIRKIQTRQDPRLDLFPCAGGQKFSCGTA